MHDECMMSAPSQVGYVLVSRQHWQHCPLFVCLLVYCPGAVVGWEIGRREAAW